MMKLTRGTVTIAGDQNRYCYTGKGYFKFGGHLERREAVMSSNGPVGFKAIPQVPYIVGEFNNDFNLSANDLDQMVDCTITLDLIDGKQIVLRNAWTDMSKSEIMEKEKIILCLWNGTSIECANQN